MPAHQRDKSISYRRAVFYPQTAGMEIETVGEYLRQALTALKTISDWAVAEGNFIQEIRHKLARRSGVTLLHIAAHTKGEHASIVPYAKADAEEADLGDAPPPPNADYMDGDMFLAIRGNDVLICTNGLRERQAWDYLRGLFKKAQLPDEATKFSLERVANPKAAQKIVAHGVKAVELDATLFEASLSRTNRVTKRQKFVGAVRDQLVALISVEGDAEITPEMENLSIEVVVKFDRRKKGKLGGKRIEKLAKDVLAEEDEGFKIRTFDGTSISHGNMTLHKKVKVKSSAKSVVYSDVWTELEKYIEELDNVGLTDE